MITDLHKLIVFLRQYTFIDIKKTIHTPLSQDFSLCKICYFRARTMGLSNYKWSIVSWYPFNQLTSSAEHLALLIIEQLKVPVKVDRYNKQILKNIGTSISKYYI